MKRTEDIINPVHKVGIKILNDVQMKNVFPDYTDVISRIEEHRKWLVEHQMQQFQQYQYNLMYDNVISIFGKRGTGKTSVAFTLHKKLEEDARHSYDIVLPIIIPEVIPADGSALGWLLAIVKDQILEFEQVLERQLAKPGDEIGTDRFWENCKYHQAGKQGFRLSEELDRLVELFHSAKYNPANELSYNIAVGNSVKQSQNYYEFAKAIVTFWDHWVSAIRELYKAQQNSREEIAPLIYFVFDDVDLAPQKVDELLSIIIKYLSHPNIIVITTADEEMFLEVIEERLNRDIGRLPKEWRHYLKSIDMNENDWGYPLEGPEEVRSNESGELICKTARRYLGKVMPTSTRYYLKEFNTVEEKRRFHLDEGMGLWEGICSQVDRLLVFSASANFLTENQTDRDYYLNFLGSTSRQVGNAYIGIRDFIDCLIEKIQSCGGKTAQNTGNKMQYTEEIYNNTWRFLHISINSNHDLAEKIEDVERFINEVFWLEHNQWRLYINYAYIDEYLRKTAAIYSRAEQVKTAFQLYSLFHFAENIFVMLESCTEEGITGRRKIHGLSYLREFLCSHVFRGRSLLRKNMAPSDFFVHYKMVLNRTERLMEAGSREKTLNLEYLYDFVHLPYTVPDNFLIESFKTDERWLQEISGILSAVYGNRYFIGREEINNCSLYKADEFLALYQQEIKTLLEDNIYKTLDEFDLLAAAKRVTKEKTSLFIEYEYKDENFNQLLREYREKFLSYYLEEEADIQDSLPIMPDEDTSFNDQEEMESTMIEPVYRMIRMVSQDLKDKNISYILSLLPLEESSDMKHRLEQAQNARDILDVLKLLYHSITEWDSEVENIFIRNIVNLDDIVEENRTNTEHSKELRRLVDYIYGFLPREYEKYDAGWYLTRGALYREVKERLNRIRYGVMWDEIFDKNGTENIEMQLGSIEEELDAAFHLTDTDEFREALLLAVKVQLAIRIQRLYLYYSVVENHNRDQEYTLTEISKERSFYSELFSQMSELVEKNTDTLSKEESAIKNLISRAASQSGKEYVRSMLQEVRI